MELVEFCSTRLLCSRICANVSDSFLAPLLALLHESVGGDKLHLCRSDYYSLVTSKIVWPTTGLLGGR